MKMKASFRAGLVILLVTTAHTACCAGAYFTSRSAFDSVLASSATITFEDLQSTPTAYGNGLNSVTSFGVTFTNQWGLLYITDPAALTNPPADGAAYPIPGTGKYLWNCDNSEPVTVLFPDGITAFGADFSGGVEPNPSFNATLTVNLAGGRSELFQFSAPRGSWIFFGTAFAEPITSIIYNDGGFYHEEMLDNVTFGTVIPEPGAWSLLAVGALLFVARKSSSRT